MIIFYFERKINEKFLEYKRMIEEFFFSFMPLTKQKLALYDLLNLAYKNPLTAYGYVRG